MTFAQLPGVDEAIKQAAPHGWEAVILVTIMFSGMAFGGWLLKQLMLRHLTTEERILKEAAERESRLALRVSGLEDMIRGELVSLIKQNSEAMGRVLSAADAIVSAANRMTQTLDRFTSVLDVRPCLLPVAEQRRLFQQQHGEGFGQVNQDVKRSQDVQ